MSIKILDNSSQAGGLGVNTDNEALVGLNHDVEKVGHASVAMESNAADDGIGRVIRTLDGSPDFRARVGIDTLAFADNFSHTVLNTSKYKIVNTTATTLLSGGKLVLNASASTASGNATQVTSFATFKLHLSFILYAEFSCRIFVESQLYNIVEFGLGYVSGVTDPSDGCFFRINALGEAVGVICYNSNEITTPLVSTGTTPFVPVAGKMYHWVISVHNDEVQFWVDDILMGIIYTPRDVGSPTLSMSLPIAMRVLNNNTVSTAQKLEVANISVSYGDQNQNRDWNLVNSVMGQSSLNAPDGATAGQTSNNANSAAPASATLSNTAAGYSTLGGQFQFAAVAGSETDYCLFCYLNPAGTSVNPGRNLVVKRIYISTFNSGAAVATTGTLLQWSVGVGSTAVSLATADSATTGARGYRRVNLENQCFEVGDPIGKCLSTVDVAFEVPLVVEAGTYFAVILKMPIGTATGSQIIRGTVGVNGYFE